MMDPVRPKSGKEEESRSTLVGSGNWGSRRRLGLEPTIVRLGVLPSFGAALVLSMVPRPSWLGAVGRTARLADLRRNGIIRLSTALIGRADNGKTKSRP